MKTKGMIDIEEALGILRGYIEKNKNTAKLVEETLSKNVSGGILNELVGRGFAVLSADKVTLTPAGEEIARDVTRRHRLAERLLADVVELPEGEIDPAACEFEHILSPEVTDAICTLLGHPRMCPHGSRIPPGPCCGQAHASTASIVTSLEQVDAGEKVRVAYIVTSEHPHLHKLLSIGLVPGTEITLHQKAPSYVIKAGETQIALDREVAAHIYVRRK